MAAAREEPRGRRVFAGQEGNGAGNAVIGEQQRSTFEFQVEDFAVEVCQAEWRG